MTLGQLINTLCDEYSLRHFYYNEFTEKTLPHAVKFEMKFNNNSYESWGVAEDKDLAYFKAIMELIERISLDRYCNLLYKKATFLSREMSLKNICETHNIPAYLLFPNNSNGVAISLKAKRAKQSALEELIERHVLLSALFLNIPPLKVKSVNLIGHNIDLFFWKFNKYFVTIAMDSLKNGGYLFTHSCSTNLELSLKKTIEELTPNVLYFEKTRTQIESKPEYSIKKNDLKSFRTYWKYSGDDRLKYFLENSLKKNKKDFSHIPNLNDVYFADIPIPSVFSRWRKKLYCYRAISPQAQQLFFDNWSLDYINPLYRTWGSIPEYPHMIS